jgi:DNA-binding response OmpR family regulator
LRFTQNQPYQFKTISAENGREALKLLESHKPDLIISDIRMPYMDGYTFLENVRKNSDWLQIPFIFLTAKGDEREIHLGRQLGVEEYIVKPYNIADVIKLIVVKLTRHHEVRQILEDDFASFKRDILTLLEPNFRTPLDSVTAYSTEIAKHLADVQTDDELKNALHGLKLASGSLSRLVEDFILLAEIKSGETASELKYESYNITNFDKLLLDTIQEWGQLNKQNSTTFQLEGVAPLPTIYGNRRTLETGLQRLVLLCKQLLKRNDQSSAIVSTFTESERVYIKLELVRVEMPASEYTLLHQITQQTNNIKYTDSDIGTSLAVATGIIHLHNGHIQIDYNEQNGITVTIDLPISNLETSPQG